MYVCPWWMGYVLINPLRRFLDRPYKLLGPYVKPGMVVLEPGCAMGYFTLPLARMVGPGGRVIAVEVQAKMLEALARRARRAGLEDRIERRLTDVQGLGVDDLAGTIDFAAALYMVHDVPDQALFFAEVHAGLKPGGKLLVRGSRGHGQENDFQDILDEARSAGFEVAEQGGRLGDRGALLVKA